MIRRLEERDLDRVMKIWMDTNMKAHSFISEKYWRGNLEAVKQMMPQSEVYVYENEGSHEIQGFIGISNDYIAGIFVRSELQSNGIGRQLLECVKEYRNRLTLSVYQKNKRAVKFYQSQGFEIQSEQVDESTGEKEYDMVWEK